MDDDGTNQTATTVSSARPPTTVSDPRRYRSPQTSANSSPVPQNATIAAGPKPSSSLSLAQSTPFIARDGASNSEAGPVKPVPSNSTTYDISHIVPQLLQFINACVSMRIKLNERDSLKVDSVRDVKLEARARAMSHHPGMVTLTKTLRENGQGGLGRLDAEIKRQKAVCQEMVNGLQDALHLAPPSLGNDMVTKLEAGLQEKAEADQAKFMKKVEADQAEFMKKLAAKYEENEAKLMEKMEANLQKTQAMEPTQQPTAKLNGNSNSEQNNTSSNLHERVEKLEEQFTKVAGSVEHYGKSHAKLSKRLFDVELWQTDMPKNSLDHGQAARQKAEEAIQKIEDFERNIRAEFEVLKSSSLSRQPPSDTDRSLKPPAGNFPGLEARLSIIERQHSAWQSLDNQMRVNTSALGILRSQLEESLKNHRLQINGLETRFGTLSHNVVNLRQNQQPPSDGLGNYLAMVQSMKTDHEALSGRVDSTAQLVQRCLRDSQQINNRVSSCDKSIESLQVAIRSLEARYSNISTESLFKNIVEVMNETFPSMETQRRDIQTLKEQLTSLAYQYTTMDDFFKEMAVLKDDVAKNIDALRAAENDANPQALNDAVRRVEEISTRIETIETTQKKHGADLVQRLEGHSYLCSRLETQLDTVVDLAEKVSELSQLSEEIKKLEPQLADIKKQLTDFEVSCSPDTIKKMCEPIQHQTETRIATQIQEVNGSTEMLSTQFTDLKNQVFASLRLREPSQSQTNGSCSGPDRENGTASPPQMVEGSPQDLPGPSPASSASPPPSTPNDSDGPPTHAPKAPRSMSKPSSSATAPRLQDRSLHIRGAASQKENEKSHPPSSQDQSLSSRVAASRQPSVKVPRPTSQLEITHAPSPLEATPRNSAAQAPFNSGKEISKNKKRQRSSNFDPQENDNYSADTALRSSDASAALSLNSDPPRKKKKAKKDKRPPNL
jgi:hypothetical protein